MTTTTGDGSYTFELSQQAEKWIVTVRSHISGAYDVTGRQDEGHEWTFGSEAEAKAWALKHARENLRQSDQELHWS